MCNWDWMFGSEKRDVQISLGVPLETQVEHFSSSNTLSSFLDSIAFPQRVYLERLTNQVNVVTATGRKEETNSPSLYFAEGTTLPTA